MGALNIHVNTSGFDAISRSLAERATKAEHVVAVRAAKDTEPYVPASQSKSLANRTKVVGNSIVYPGPYARYLYYGKLMVDPETGSAWAKKGATKVLTDRNLVFSQAVNGQAQSHWFEASKAENMDKWAGVAGKEMVRYGGE